jgi:hypothetical protein
MSNRAAHRFSPVAVNYLFAGSNTRAVCRRTGIEAPRRKRRGIFDL